MGVKVITPAAAVLTMEELRPHLRTHESSGDDSLVMDYLAAAQEFAQHYTGCAIGTQVLELALPGFPSGAIVLPVGPATSITSVKYIDIAGVEQTVPGGNYALDDYGLQCSVVPIYGSSWPASQPSTNAVKLRYAAGVGTVPRAVKQALMLLVGHYYLNREDAMEIELESIPTGARALLDTVRTWSL